MTIQEEHKQAIQECYYALKTTQAQAAESCAEITKKHAIGFAVWIGENYHKRDDRHLEDKKFWYLPIKSLTDFNPVSSNDLFQIYLNQLPT